MKITPEQAKLAGQSTKQTSLTDEELDLILQIHRLSLAYLEGKGSTWQLAITPLRHELYTFEGFDKARKKGSL